MRRHAFKLLLGLCVLAASLEPVTTTAEPNTPFLDTTGRPAFLTGANYEGPADRAWQMWTDTSFDSQLIEQDFARARAAHLSLLRIFVQPPLADDVRAKRFKKLDRVLDLADR